MPSPDEKELPGTSWDIRVDQLMQDYNATQQIARDFVILEWLFKGDTAPFTAFVLQGHAPNEEVVKYTALMMNPAKGTEEIVPYALKVRSQGRKGRRPNPRIEIRDKLLAQNVERRMKEGKSYNQALDEVADVLGEELDSDPRDTVEKAYKRYKSKQQR